LVLFEFNDTEFEICEFQTTFGISTTNRIYSSQKKLSSVSYKKGKFWYINNRNKQKTIQPLTYGNFIRFIQETENLYNYSNDKSETLAKSKIFSYFKERFPWVMTLSESKISYGTTFNVVVSKGLFGLKALNRHIMKVPINIANMILDSEAFQFLKSDGIPIKKWYGVMKVLDNIENVTPELLNDHLFADTCKMAQTLGRKINCAWGPKRLKEEHDKWAKEITRIILDCEIEYDLNIRPIYKSFAEFSGYQLLKTNKDMLAEGMLQHHCVGTYIDRVDKGQTAIFHVKGFTLQVEVFDLNWKGYYENNENVKTKTFYIREHFAYEDHYKKIDPSHKKALINVQFRGKFNQSAPQELVDEVNQMLIYFVNANGFENTTMGEETYRPNNLNRGTVNNLLMAFGDIDALPF
jgi:hypothetical protein